MNVAGKGIVQNVRLTTQQFKELNLRETLKQSSAFKELLKDQQISYDQLEKEVETIQPEVSAIPIA